MKVKKSWNWFVYTLTLILFRLDNDYKLNGLRFKLCIWIFFNSILNIFLIVLKSIGRNIQDNLCSIIYVFFWIRNSHMCSSAAYKLSLQSHPRFQTGVVDDASTKENLKVASDIRLRTTTLIHVLLSLF